MVDIVMYKIFKRTDSSLARSPSHTRPAPQTLSDKARPVSVLVTPHTERAHSISYRIMQKPAEHCREHCLIFRLVGHVRLGPYLYNAVHNITSRDVSVESWNLSVLPLVRSGWLIATNCLGPLQLGNW